MRDDFDKLTVPTGDGEVLVRPRAAGLVRLVEQNRRWRGTNPLRLLGRPASDWAEVPTGAPVIMTGHQPEFFHPGVWAKRAAASDLARRLDGRAVFAAVDSDSARELVLRWPRLESGYCRMESDSPFDAASEHSFAGLPRLGRGQWQVVFDRLLNAWRDVPTSLMSAFADGFLGGSVPADIAAGLEHVESWTRGIEAVERALGVEPPEPSSVSRLFGPDGSRWAAVFVVHTLLHAEEFANTYNNALAEHRRRRGIRGRHHPVPDLAIDGELVEVPFWLMRAGALRQRLYIASRGSAGVEVFAGAQPAGVLDRNAAERDATAALRVGLRGWTVAPRALTLTMGLRLFACDLFIHGVGGARYDQITDEIIRRFWRVEPPGYACVSATLRLPLPTFEAVEADAAAWRWKIRDFAYNPQRYLNDEDRRAIETLLTERQAAIGESDRLKVSAPEDHLARQTAFERIRHANQGIVRSPPAWLPMARGQQAEAERRLAHNLVAGSREWFLALYPLDRLAGLGQRLRLECE